MAHPAETPPQSNPEPEPLPATADEQTTAFTLTGYDLTVIAEHLGKGRDYVSSFTSFLASDIFSLDKALSMLGLSSAAEAQERLEEIRKRQYESLQSNVEQAKSFGGKVVDTASLLNPLRYIKRR